jgi:predicted RNase H-like nuclease (RuvC/YqgF family)
MLIDDFSLTGNEISEVRTLTADEIRSIPGGPALSSRIVNFVQNYAARNKLNQTNVRILNGLSSYLAMTKKERKSHRGPAGPSTKQYEKHLETCEAELVELRLQLQQLQEKVTRAESYRAMLKAQVEEQRIIDQQQERPDDYVEMELQHFLDVYLASSFT